MVYVDDMEAPYRGMRMCHMIADSDDELHAMADAIGMNRKWHQAPPRHDSHYDICLSMKKRAIKCGAKPITWKQLGIMNLMRRSTGTLPTPEEAAAWYEQRKNGKVA